MESPLTLEIHWKTIKGDRDPLWLTDMGLYAYLALKLHELVYIDSLDEVTLWRHWTSDDAKKLWKDWEEERGLVPEVFIMVGLFVLPKGSRLTHPLVADARCLLVDGMKPWGNRNDKIVTPSHPELLVRSKGDWPPTFESVFSHEE